MKSFKIGDIVRVKNNTSIENLNHFYRYIISSYPLDIQDLETPLDNVAYFHVDKRLYNLVSNIFREDSLCNTDD